MGDIARAKGMTQVAREAGLSRESLYKALSGDRSPSFDTILKVISALGLQLSASVKESAIVEDVSEPATQGQRTQSPFPPSISRAEPLR